MDGGWGLHTEPDVSKPIESRYVTCFLEGKSSNFKWMSRREEKRLGKTNQLDTWTLAVFCLQNLKCLSYLLFLLIRSL